MVKKKFRTFYDTNNYVFTEKVCIKDLCDPSEYKDTAEIVADFTRGVMPRASNSLNYDFDINDSAENAFDESDSQDKINAEFENLAESEAVKRYVELKEKIKKGKEKIEKLRNKRSAPKKEGEEQIEGEIIKPLKVEKKTDDDTTGQAIKRAGE